MGIEAGTIGTQMVIDNDGNVGIGTPSPAAHLQIHHATLATARLTAGSHTSGYDMLLDSGGNAYLYNRNNGVLTFGTNNTDRMRITNAGNVGIGTTAPGAKLHLSGGDGSNAFTAAIIALGYSTTGQYPHFIHTRHNSSALTGNAIDFYTGDRTAAGVFPTNAVHGMTIESGNVGIGTTAPTQKLDVVGTVKATAFSGDGSALTNLPGGGGGNASYGGATPGTPANAVYALADGKVGIGTTNPGAMLDVAGGIKATAKVYGGDKIYNTVLIGTQWWMAENLNEGTKINSTTAQANNSTIEKYCYGDDEANCTAEGGLYQWDEAMNWATAEGAKGLCPDSWHIPTDKDWKTLEAYLGMSKTGDAYNIDDTSKWRGSTQGTQLKAGGTSGFAGVLAGRRNTDGAFYDQGTYAHLWSSSESGGSAWDRNLYSGYSSVYRGTYGKALGLSVRCVKD